MVTARELRMKIAFVYDVIYPYVKGGVEKRIRELAVRLSARGHDVHICRHEILGRIRYP